MGPGTETPAGEPAESAQAVVRNDDADGVPRALVAIAAIGVAISGAATSVPTRSLRRRA